MNLSIIIVIHNTKELIGQSLNELLKIKTDLGWEIIFIDNNSEDGTKKYLAELQRSRSFIKVIFNKENFGFAKAVNQGIKISQGDSVLLLNSDAFISQAQIKELWETLKSDSKIAIIAPRLLNIDGSIQPSFGNFPSIMTMIFYLSRLDKILPWGMAVYPEKSSKPQLKKPDWISGACLLIKKEVFDKIGLFDEHYFMGIEDIDFCYRVRLSGYVVVYFSAVTITHYHQYSSKKFHKKLSVIRAENQSLKYFYRKFYPKAKIRYYIFSFFVGAKDALQSLKIYYENHFTNK